MAKDTYWFKHDYNAGRGTRLQKIQFIYGHEGKGFYWDVIEVLRGQDGYGFPYSDFDLQMLASIIGAKDTTKFLNFIHDSVKYELLFVEDKKLYSRCLIDNMKVWESKKKSGMEAKSKRNRSEIEAKSKRIESVLPVEEKRREEKSIYVFTPPSVGEVRQYFMDKGYDPDIGERAYESYSVASWVDSKGSKIRNWKQKMIQVWFKPEHKVRSAPLTGDVKKVDAIEIFPDTGA